MTTQVAFLRAVNVGNRRVQMARVAEVVGALGFAEVWTYINSGNVVFDGGGRRAALERRIGRALEAEYGFEVTTFVRSVAEIRAALDMAPFPVEDGDTYFVTFLADAPGPDVAAEFEAQSNDFDTVVVRGRDVHWRMRGPSVETTLGKKQWRLVGEFSTSRNVTMLRKLLAKIDSR